MSSLPAESPAPRWFHEALSETPEKGTTRVHGVEVKFYAWGDPGPGVVLVHGGGAHAHWWDHVAPLLTDGRRRVVALDLSGHGDSGRRVRYTLDDWAEEVFVVSKAGRILGVPTIVGHSMGGFVTLRVGARYGNALRGVVVVDSPVRTLTPEELAVRQGRALRRFPVYGSSEEAMAHFRPSPDQDSLEFVKAHIAATSIQALPGGWGWKFDPHIFARPHLSPEEVSVLACRVALIRGQFGILSESMSEALYDRLGRVAPIIEVPAAGHHIMLDQPLALVATLRTLLADWDHSEPAATAVGVEEDATRPRR